MASNLTSSPRSLSTDNWKDPFRRPSERWTRLNCQPAEQESSIQPERGDVPVYLTWEDLWVTASDGKGSSTTILSGLTGFAQPAQVLAVMGPSGCGKTTLLDVLAGRLTSRMSKSGIVLVNGQTQTLAYGTSAYVTHEDVLTTTLTVKEAIYYSAELLLPDSMSKSQKKERAEKVIIEMGLKDAMDTRIGGRTTKGISSGQKKRVSICIETLTRPKLLFLDEPTSGLDSAASYHVMSRIVNQARQYDGTVITSIHQPSSEIFDLFDNLCLLCAGKTIYFGPISSTTEFFTTHGFPCPQMRNPSDHFLRTINKDFDMVIGQSGSYVRTNNTSEAIDILINSYKSSNICQDMLRKVAQISSMVSYKQFNEGESVKKEEQARFITQCSVLTKRSFKNMYRDPGYYWLRLAFYAALGICLGTLFYDVGFDYESIQARGALLTFIAVYFTFLAIGGFPSFVEDLKIFYREQLNGHYSVVAFTISNSLSSMPFLLLITLIPATISYFMSDLQRDADHFIFFYLIIYSSMLLIESLMMIVAAIVPDFLMGIITGAGIQGWMILACGFFRLPNDLPKPMWVYPTYYISIHRYANQGLFKNEFIGLTFPSSDSQNGGNSTIEGIEIVRDYWQMQVGYSKWVDLCILFGMALLYRFLFWATIRIGEELKARDRVVFKQKQVMELSLSNLAENIDGVGFLEEKHSEDRV
ncbi:ABC transporter G family member 11-like [Dendrobium catenatum]|uniref:ABC transporter G family member 11-like n=1 Tax=Dendrobium catenatum TaxID=906689 RepID=UPI0009F6DAD8|nr:ABC transporter G family member 11-like [Dendrobium catenatum]